AGRDRADRGPVEAALRARNRRRRHPGTRGCRRRVRPRRSLPVATTVQGDRRRQGHLRLAMSPRNRYGEWRGGPDPLAPPYDVHSALDEIGDAVLDGLSPSEAM